MSERLFVTGAAGMIGSNICDALVAAGHDVVGVDNLWRGKLSNLSRVLSHKGFEFRHADIASDQDWHRDLNSKSVIVHTADIVAGIGFVFKNEWSIFQKNNLINTQIARVLQQYQPAHLIYLGTACSYPQTMQRSIDASVLAESDKFPADPESGYGWSKLLGDVEFNLAVKGTSSRLTVLDLHNVYGWPCVYQDATSQVIPALINKSVSSTDGVLNVWGDGKQGRAFLHVDDVVQAVKRTLAYNGDKTNFMIGPQKCTTIGEVAALIQQHPKIDIQKIEYDTSKPVGDIGRFANPRLAQKELGWQEDVCFKDGLFSLIDNIIEHRQSNSL